MGRDPILLSVGNWTLEAAINDFGLALTMHAGSGSRSMHFMRFEWKQAALLRDYLNENLPSK